MSAPVIYSTSFVYYDINGKLYGLGNVPSTEYKNFEIDNSLVEDFYLLKKQLTNYNIEYFYNISKGIDEPEEEIKLIDTSLSLHIIGRTIAYNNEITIEHNSKWVIQVREDVKEKLDIIPNLIFFVCKPDDPYFLYRHFSVDTSLLKVQPVEIDFQLPIEHNLQIIILATIRKFNSYVRK